MLKQITITLPIGSSERISHIIQEHGIFEDHEDFITHAIIDLLEEYK
jgi:hypothetical protein